MRRIAQINVSHFTVLISFVIPHVSSVGGGLVALGASGAAGPICVLDKRRSAE